MITSTQPGRSRGDQWSDFSAHLDQIRELIGPKVDVPAASMFLGVPLSAGAPVPMLMGVPVHASGALPRTVQKKQLRERKWVRRKMFEPGRRFDMTLTEEPYVMIIQGQLIAHPDTLELIKAQMTCDRNFAEGRAA